MVLYERDQKNPHIIGRLLVLEILRINGVTANSSVDRSMQIDFSYSYIPEPPNREPPNRESSIILSFSTIIINIILHLDSHCMHKV